MIFFLNGRCASDERSSEGQLWPRFTLSNLKNPEVLTGVPPSCLVNHFNWDVDDMSFLDNSSIYIEEFDFSTREYCIDHMEEAIGTLKETVYVCANKAELKRRVCTLVTKLQQYFTGVSCLSLVATLCLFAFFPKIRRQKLHTWSFISMISAQLVALIAFEVNRSTVINSPAGCMFLAEICLVSVLAMFFWYSVISFDLAVKTWDGPELRDSRRWFLMYSMYAWGCPLVVGAVFLLLNTLKPTNAILPDIKPPNCWLTTHSAQWAYMKGFILAVMLVNLLMFVHLLYRLVQLRRSSMRVKTPYSHLCRRFRLPLSLGVMIGVCWLGEVVSNSNCTSIMANVQTVVSGMQGVFILLLVLSNTKNRQAILDERSTVRVLIRSLRRHQTRENTTNKQPGNIINDIPPDADQSGRVLTYTQNVALETSADILGSTEMRDVTSESLIE